MEKTLLCTSFVLICRNSSTVVPGHIALRTNRLVPISSESAQITAEDPRISYGYYVFIVEEAVLNNDGSIKGFRFQE